MHLPERSRHKVLVLQKTAADHCQRWCLHTSEAVCSFSCCDGQCLGGVDAHKPVGLASCLGRQKKVVIVVTVLDVLQSFLDSLVGQRTDPETLKRDVTAEVLVEVAENQFALASSICGNDDLFCMLEEVLDDA